MILTGYPQLSGKGMEDREKQSHSLERTRRGFLGAWTVEESLVGVTQERKCALSRGNHSIKSQAGAREPHSGLIKLQLGWPGGALKVRAV